MRKKETDKALEIASQIQELIYYIIPEKWKNIELYISMPDMGIRKGELFFYYLPNSIFKRQYINCYEVPYMFNISEKEYSDIMSKLYNKFMILKEELNKNNRQVEEIYVHITKTNYMMEIATDNLVLKRKDIRRNMLMLYSSYENHIIWRYLNLNILPDEKKEKEIINTSNCNQFDRFHVWVCELFEKDPVRFKLSKQRREKLRLRLKELGEERLKTAFISISKSEFHRGNNDRGWKIDTDPYWLVANYERAEKWSNTISEDETPDLSKVEIKL